ncbi:poly-beta-1,6-N-acetyl-D-glucosamine synthase [mine drainage metagenome]|uniref:Poly-beta-1,6-N-acetyl-D-glucosamine synthase n=1 Tax=mine drainage metagenome TaxID=410659 RepID=A0A1J5S570_9ZZZZ
MKVGNGYVLISPCRDEADYMRQTLDSVVAQSLRPAKWIIIDDGSTDETPQILGEYARQHDWIEIVTRSNRGRRAVGPGVIDAFYAGLDTISLGDFEYLCKFDLDLNIPPRYFELLIERMKQQPRLGTCSGKPYFPDPDTGELISEMCGDEMSVGMTKFYRTRCFEEIGGFVREVMWDGIDCHTCRMKGWLARSWDDPDLRFLHLRAMGSSQKGMLTGRQRHGFGQYFMGTWFPYMVASAAFRMTRPPVVVGGLAMLWGYITSWARGLPKYNNAEFIRFLHAYQKRCMIVGKRKATEEIEQKILGTNHQVVV